MKEKLSMTLGRAGVVLWYIISFLYSFAPLISLRYSFFVELILIIVMTTVPILGEITRIVLYVLAFIVEIGRPIDVFSIIFFVFAALYFFTTVIPIICAIFSKNK